MGILKFKYATNEKIWGKEDWIISAHDNGMSYLKGKEISLKEFYKNNRNLFGIQDKEFPLLVKIIEANDNLSVQVHPDDRYALECEGSLGKTECWYILSDNKDSEILIGQKAKNKEELKEAIQNKQIMDKLNVFPIKKDDFYLINSGTVHAILKNTKILEIQQSSDITYRLYDYDRRDNQGKLRDLHIDKSLDVINYEEYKVNKDYKILNKSESYKVEELTKNKFFNVNKVAISGEYSLVDNDKYFMAIVIDGDIYLNEEKIDNMTGVIVLKGTQATFKGNGKIIITS